MRAVSVKKNAQSRAFLWTFLSGSIIWFLPTPSGIEEQAWHLLAIFIATIVGFITKPIPMGAVALIALVTLVMTKTLTLAQGLSGFSHPTSWLTFSSFLIARGFIKTGLASRLAYLFIRILGQNTLLLSYGLLATDLVLAPGMPSGNARAGGVIFPLVKSLAQIYQSEPHDGSARRIGSFLMLTSFQGTQITTALFFTAMVANPLMAGLAGTIAGVEITWFSWALAALVPGVISLLIMPLIIYYLYPPRIKRTPKAKKLAQNKLAQMGKISNPEWCMALTFFLLLLLWIFGDSLGGIKSATTALLGVALLVVTQVLSWEEITAEKKAWNILLWFSILLMMASFLNEFGLVNFVSEQIQGFIDSFSWQLAFSVLSIVYFYNGYFFASKAARASAMYAPFLSVALAVGTPPVYAALVLAFLLNLSGCLTHYGTAVAPIYFGSGYVDIRVWWKIGFILSVVYLPIWLGIGGVWWRILGLI
ncbi:MAG: anion permease [Xenococcaceae cyanobacterium MO_167.B52]|nr:anion permease [Xenococcaceae cyanobacterium MO_167.B52]